MALPGDLIRLLSNGQPSSPFLRKRTLIPGAPAGPPYLHSNYQATSRSKNPGVLPLGSGLFSGDRRAGNNLRLNNAGEFSKGLSTEDELNMVYDAFSNPGGGGL